MKCEKPVRDVEKRIANYWNTALYLQLKDVSLRFNSKPFGGLANFQKIFKRFKWR